VHNYRTVYKPLAHYFNNKSLKYVFIIVSLSANKYTCIIK